MKRDDRGDELLALVREVMQRRAERVDAEAFLARLNRRRRRARLPAWLLPAAAAAVVMAAAVIILHAAAPAPRPVKPPLLALNQCTEALRTELSAAAGGARVVGSAAVSATKTPLKQLADARLPLPDLEGLNELWPADPGRPDMPQPQENAP